MWSAQCLLTAVSDDVGLECSNLRWLGIFTFSGACACVCLYWNSADNGKKLKVTTEEAAWCGWAQSVLTVFELRLS